MSDVTTAHEYEGEPLFENHYVCEECGELWQDVWYATCDDECPNCGEEMTPLFSYELYPYGGRKMENKLTMKQVKELIREARIWNHTKKIAARMVEQQREEFNSWGHPWAI